MADNIALFFIVFIYPSFEQVKPIGDRLKYINAFGLSYDFHALKS